MTLTGTTTMLAIALRTGWKAVLAWVLALAGTMVATTSSISGLYDTQAKIDSYAQAVGSGDALLAINGHVAGIDTLGGVIANEFGFMASFALPLMGISLVARATRREEEAGRLDLLLAGRIGRTAPLLAATVVTLGALAAAAAALALGLLSVGVAPAGALLYAVSLGALGLVFAGVAALAAQVVGQPRGIYVLGLSVLVAAYLLRGIGDVLDSPVTWLSPLGWAEKVRAFGDARWWPLLVPLAVGTALLVLAVLLNRRRDLGEARWRRRASAESASDFLRTPLGLAVHLHRGAVVGWSVVAVVVSATFGALAQQLIDAMAGNPSLERSFGGTGAASIDGFLAMSVLLLALLSAAYLVQAAGGLRSEETAGRLEVQLAGTLSRRRWLGTHLAVILVGLAVVVGTGASALGLATAWSTGDAGQTGRLLNASVAYLPAVLVLGALALALFGVLPRAQPVAWLVYAATAVLAFLGSPLQLSETTLALVATHHVGYPPLEDVDGRGLVGLAALALLLGLVAVAGFRRRGVPQG